MRKLPRYRPSDSVAASPVALCPTAGLCWSTRNSISVVVPSHCVPPIPTIRSVRCARVSVFKGCALLFGYVGPGPPPSPFALFDESCIAKLCCAHPRCSTGACIAKNEPGTARAVQRYRRPNCYPCVCAARHSGVCASSLLSRSRLCICGLESSGHTVLLVSFVHIVTTRKRKQVGLRRHFKGLVKRGTKSGWLRQGWRESAGYNGRSTIYRQV